MDDHVVLRPVREDDLPMLEALTQDPEKAGEFGWFGWAGTEVDNIAEQRALEKAGFTREGVTRAAGWRDGAWRDGMVYSLLRTDPPI